MPKRRAERQPYQVIDPTTGKPIDVARAAALRAVEKRHVRETDAISGAYDASLERSPSTGPLERPLWQ